MDNPILASSNFSASPGFEGVRPGGSLSIRILPSCKVSDLLAFFDTFGIVLERRGLVYLQGLAIWFSGVIVSRADPDDWPLPPVFDESWEVNLFANGPIEGHEYYRWPFWVSETLKGRIYLLRPDGNMQWWAFKCEPGRKYSKPLLVGRSDPPEATPPTEAKT
jgi:hypothetical protein